MHITILTAGSRGDVQPYVALGHGLQAAGHQVKLVTSERFAPFVEQYGLTFASLEADFMQLAETAEGRARLGARNSLLLMRTIRPMLRRMLDAGWQAAQDADVLLYHPKALGGYHLGEKLAIPTILTHPIPLASPTGDFAAVALSLPNLGRWGNRTSQRVLWKLIQAPYRSLINTWRRERLGLGPYKDDLQRADHPEPCLYGYSPALVPVPDDWESQWVCVSGYWFLPFTPPWEPPQQLVQFIEAGAAPIYIGFGSMPPMHAQRLTAMVVEAVQKTGIRAVLATGGGALDAVADENIYALEAAPHEWLFPRMAAIVHHGGAGTTAAALRAGKPMLICPFLGDQGFWGRRVAALGAGLPPIPRRRLSLPKLMYALRQLIDDQALTAAAATLGAHIRNEDGITTAVKFVECIGKRA